MPNKINFKELREQQGVKQYELSDLTGLTPATISRLENGITEPTLETTVKYLDAIGLKITIVNK